MGEFGGIYFIMFINFLKLNGFNKYMYVLIGPFIKNIFGNP